MNNTSQTLINIARRIAPIYAEQLHCAAIVCGGSAARGLADDASDLDLALCLENPCSYSLPIPQF